MKPAVSLAFLANLAQRHNNKFTSAKTVTIEMGPGECPEAWGHDLRLWCRTHCEQRYQQVKRGAADSVTISFESDKDASRFRRAH